MNASNDEDIAPRFYGTWRLVAVNRWDPDTGAKLDQDAVYDGTIAYTPERRVSVIITRTTPGQPRFITCYGARWTIEGDEVVHHVDIGSTEGREGTSQRRRFDFEDDTLTLTPPLSPDFTRKATRRNLVWKRIPIS